MRSFFRVHWKVIVAIILLVVLATVTVNPSAATPVAGLPATGSPAVTDARLALRLRTHAAALAAAGDGGGAYIEHALRVQGYRVRMTHAAGEAGGSGIEAALANLAPGARPARLFVIGARYGRMPGLAGGRTGDAADPATAGEARQVDASEAAASANDGDVAAVLELARLLQRLHPRRGTEIRFVFLAGAAPARPPVRLPGLGRNADVKPCPAQWLAGGGPDCLNGAGGFIAYAGTPASMHAVQAALSGFRSMADVPLRGLAAPAYVRGVTLSEAPAPGRAAAIAVMLTDTEFLRFPYYNTVGGAATDELDDAGIARVVAALARTIAALAGNRRG